MIDKIKKITQNTIVKDLFSQSVWSTIGAIIAKGFLFSIWVIIARILSISVYGEFCIVRNTTFLFVQFASLSFGFASAKYIAQYFNHDNEKVERLAGLFLLCSIVIGFILFIIFYMSSEWICINMLNAPALSKQLKYTSVVLLLSSFSGSQVGILSGFNQYKIIAKINVLQIVLSFPFFIVLTYKYNLNGAVFAYVIFNIILSILSYFELNKFCRSSGIKISFKFRKDEFKMIFYYVIPYFLAVFVTMLSSWYNETVLVSVSVNGFTDMGYFSAVNVFQLMIIGITIMFCTPFVSMISKYKSDDNRKILEKLNFIFPLYLSLLITFIVVLFPEIFSFLYGKNYANNLVYNIVVVMALYTVVIIYKQALARLVAVYELQRLYLFDSILFSILCVICFHCLKSFGAIGIAYSYFISYIVSSIIITPFYIKRKMIKLELFCDKYLVVLFILNVFSLLLYLTIDNLLIRLSVFVFIMAFIAFVLKSRKNVARDK
ncbi:MAG: hypothetical protein PARBA_01070 [Parabacteroides sp.]